MDFYEDYDDFEGLPRIKNMSIDRSSRPWKSKANGEKQLQE